MRRSLVAGMMLCALASPARSAAGADPVLEYLYVDANEGGASGGHVALRFDTVVYHFQHEEPRVLRLARHDDRHFFHLYGDLLNRTIRASRVAVSDDTFSLLRDAFETRREAEEGWFDRVAALEEDEALLDALLAGRAGDTVAGSPPAVALPAAGFFLEDGGARVATPVGGPDPDLARLRARVVAAHGATFLAERRAALAADLATLAPDPAPDATPPEDPDTGPPVRYEFARRYADRLGALRALDVLAAAIPLRPGSLRSPRDDAAAGGATFALDPGEEARLAATADALERRLVEGVRSARPDFGFPLLVGMARLVALRESVRTHRLAVVDAFSDRHDVVTRDALARARPDWPSMRAQNRAAFEAARAGFFGAAAPGERELASLETAANRLLELEEGVRGERPVRAEAGRLVPRRSARRADLVQPAASDGALRAARDAARAGARSLAASLERTYAYDLVTRNCVSEVFRLVDRALALAGASAGEGSAEGAAAAESARRLGGHVEVDGTLNFIPFVSAGAVAERWRVVRRTERPSHRHARLDEMTRREGTARVRLRESNVLTSTIYRKAARDSTFLFFTDDALVARPLLGALNLGTGIVAAAAGVLAAPFDGGAIFASGAWGAIFSLPELAFFNIRKGTFDHVPEAPGEAP